MSFKSQSIVITVKVRSDAPDFALPQLVKTTKESLEAWVKVVGAGFEGLIQWEVTDGPD